MGGLRTVLSHGLLQRKVLRRPSGVVHAAMVASMLILAAGSLWLQIDNRLARAVGLPLPRGLAYQALQGLLDLSGLVLMAAVLALLARRLLGRPAHLPRSGQVTVTLLSLLLIAGSGFALEGLRMSQEQGVHQRWAVVGGAVAAALGDPADSPHPDRLRAWRALYWGHALLAMSFLAAIPWTRMRHALTAPNHLRSAAPLPRPALSTPFKLASLLAEGRFDVAFGLGKVGDLDGRRAELLACTQCGRCEEQCPAHATGTALSPRALLASLAQAAGGEPDRDLFDGVVTEEMVWSCAQCGACAEACPVLVQPHELIADLRRTLVQRGGLDPKKTALLEALSRADNPYGSPRWKREELADELGVPLLEEDPEAEVVYWVGCAATYDARTRKVAEATIALLRRAGLRPAILGEEECCTGDVARRVGEEGRFQELVGRNLRALRAVGTRMIVTHCPHCLNTLRNEYPDFGDAVQVVHHSELLGRLVEEGALPAAATEGDPGGAVTLHDPCFLGRFNRTWQAPRDVLRAAGAELREMERREARSFCCGGGGGNYWYTVPRDETMGAARLRQAQQTGAEAVATACPFCLRMLEEARDGEAPSTSPRLEILDIAELLAGKVGA